MNSKVGAAGGVPTTVAPMVSDKAVDTAPAVPNMLVWTAVSACVPRVRVLVAMDHSPFAATVVEPIDTPPLDRVRVSPASPVPAMTGVVTVVILSPRVPVSLTGARVRLAAAGGAALTVTDRAVEAAA